MDGDSVGGVIGIGSDYGIVVGGIMGLVYEPVAHWIDLYSGYVSNQDLHHATLTNVPEGATHVRLNVLCKGGSDFVVIFGPDGSNIQDAVYNYENTFHSDHVVVPIDYEHALDNVEFYLGGSGGGNVYLKIVGYYFSAE